MIKAISVGLYRDPTGIGNPRLIQKVLSRGLTNLKGVKFRDRNPF